MDAKTFFDRFARSLGKEDQESLSTMERAAMAKETRDLLSKINVRKKAGTEMKVAQPVFPSKVDQKVDPLSPDAVPPMGAPPAAGPGPVMSDMDGGMPSAGPGAVMSDFGGGPGPVMGSPDPLAAPPMGGPGPVMGAPDPLALPPGGLPPDPLAAPPAGLAPQAPSAGGPGAVMAQPAPGVVPGGPGPVMAQPAPGSMSPSPQTLAEMPMSAEAIPLPMPEDKELGLGMTKQDAPVPSGIDEFSADEKKEEEKPISSTEMGVEDKNAGFHSVYAHLRIRSTPTRDLELYNPQNKNAVLMVISPNKATKGDTTKLNRCAIKVLQTLTKEGLARTATIWRAKVAADGCTGYGVNDMSDKRKSDEKPITSTDEDDMQAKRESKPESTTGKGENTDASKKHEERRPAGLSGKAAASSSDSLADAKSDMQDERKEGPHGNAIDSLKDAKSDMQDERGKKDKGSDSMLDDAVTTFANEALDSKKAEAAKKDEDEVTDETEKKIATLYRARAEKEVTEKTRTFVARLVRCIRMAARRQALNLEPNVLKMAMADSLMTEAPVSQHEVFVPMDARTATFAIERGLNQKAAIEFVDQLVSRAASFMKMSDEALMSVEADLNQINPVEPAVKNAEPDPGASVMQNMAAAPVPVSGTVPTQMQAAKREAAIRGNFEINTAIAEPAMPTDQRREIIRYAVSGTKGSDLRSYFGK